MIRIDIKTRFSPCIRVIGVMIFSLLLAPGVLGQNLTVGDDVGADHIAFTFAPYLWAGASGENEYRDHVSSAPGMGQQYSYIQYAETDSPTTNPPIFCTVAQFYTLLHDETDFLGTLLITTHGGNDKISIEPFEKTPAGDIARNTRYQAYLDSTTGIPNLPKFTTDEIYKSENVDAHAIGIKAGFITKYGRLTQGLVYTGACHGGTLVDDFVADDARVAIGEDGGFTPAEIAGHVNTFFLRMDGKQGQLNRPVSAAKTGLPLTVAGQENTTLAPSVLTLTAPCPIKTGDKVTYTLDTRCEVGITPDIVGTGCTIQNEVWLNGFTLEGTCTAPPPPGAFIFALRLKWDNTYSDQNVARLDGNTNPAGSNAEGPAHDDYVKNFNCKPDYELRIKEVPAWPCQHVDVPVSLCNVDSVGGYNILIHWDCTLAELVDVEQKYYYVDGDSFQFEYFNWTTWEVDDGCKVRIVGLHDKPNDEDTPPIPPGQDQPLFDLIFHPSNTWDLNYSIPITFEIDQCGDNALSDPTGYVLYTPPDPGDAYGDTTCPLNPPPDPYPDPGNPTVTLIDGCIYAEYLDRGEFVGDINLNGTKYEVADATLYLEYLNGEATLIDEDRQRTASDINLDGTPWSIADVVLLIDIINGYATPLAKVMPTEEVADVSISGNAVSAKFAVPVGGAYFVIKHGGEVTKPLLDARAKGMDVKWSERDGELRVILYSWKSRRMEPGSGVLFTVPGATNLTISQVQFSDANGSLMKVRSVPTEFALKQNYPNPFNLTTRIAFDLPEDVDVTLTVYNISGQKVADLVKGKVKAGHHAVTWDVRDVSSGIYFYTINAGDFTATRKMVLLK